MSVIRECSGVIRLGNAGEHLKNVIALNIPEDWQGATSDNVMFLFAPPKTDAAVPYDVIVEDGVAYINVVSSMTIAGIGQAQLSLYKETSENVFEVIAKTQIFITKCEHSLDESEPEQPHSTWIDKILEIVGKWTSGKIQKKLVAGDDSVEIVRGENEDAITATGGGTKLYRHSISLMDDSQFVSTTDKLTAHIVIVSSRSTRVQTLNDVRQLLYETPNPNSDINKGFCRMGRVFVYGNGDIGYEAIYEDIDAESMKLEWKTWVFSTLNTVVTGSIREV